MKQSRKYSKISSQCLPDVRESLLPKRSFVSRQFRRIREGEALFPRRLRNRRACMHHAYTLVSQCTVATGKEQEKRHISPLHSPHREQSESWLAIAQSSASQSNANSGRGKTVARMLEKPTTETPDTACDPWGSKSKRIGCSDYQGNSIIARFSAGFIASLHDRSIDATTNERNND